jgi:hypothetical protein
MDYFEMNLNMAIAFRVKVSYNFDPLYDYLLYIRKVYNKISIKHKINMWERSFLLLCET